MQQTSYCGHGKRIKKVEKNEKADAWHCSQYAEWTELNEWYYACVLQPPLYCSCPWIHAQVRFWIWKSDSKLLKDSILLISNPIYFLWFLTQAELNSRCGQMITSNWVSIASFHRLPFITALQWLAVCVCVSPNTQVEQKRISLNHFKGHVCLFAQVALRWGSVK